MQRIIAAFVALLVVLGAVAQAGAHLRHYQSVSATQSNSAITTFTDNRSGGTSVTFRPYTIVVINDGANEVFADPGDDGVATAAADVEIKAGESVTFVWDSRTPGDGYTSLGLICSTGETATVRVIAQR